MAYYLSKPYQMKGNLLNLSDNGSFPSNLTNNLVMLKYSKVGSTSCVNMFRGNTSFNSPVIIGEKVTNCSNMFYGCTNFNSYVLHYGGFYFIPPSGGSTNHGIKSVIFQDGSYMFYNCTKFNYPVSFGYTVTNLYSCFRNCTNFNSDVLMGTSASNKDVDFNFAYLFSGCSNFDSSVNFYYFSSSNTRISNFAWAFDGCIKFNNLYGNTLPPASCLDYMFHNCYNFNQNVVFTTTVTTPTSCAGMFKNCSIFNQAVVIPAGVQNCRDMFNGCTNLNLNMVIPASVTDATLMFGNCTKFGGTGRKISININSSITSYNYHGILSGKSNSLRVNIFCNNLSYLNKTTASTSITGTDITWASQTNGYKNTVYNIYLYKNYTGKT